jgi:hypothetical protein
MEAFMSGHLFDKGMLSQTGAKWKQQRQICN